MELDVVQKFMHDHNMHGKLCIRRDEYSLILYRFPYVVEFHDALIDNYLEISLSDISMELLLTGSRAVPISCQLGFQNIEELKIMNFTNDPKNNIFISEGSRKMLDLHCDFEAINKLLPSIEAKGGLASIQNGTFDTRFDFKDYLKPMYFGLKDKYLNCIHETD